MGTALSNKLPKLCFFPLLFSHSSSLFSWEISAYPIFSTFPVLPPSPLSCPPAGLWGLTLVHTVHHDREVPLCPSVCLRQPSALPLETTRLDYVIQLADKQGRGPCVKYRPTWSWHAGCWDYTHDAAVRNASLSHTRWGHGKLSGIIGWWWWWGVGPRRERVGRGHYSAGLEGVG